MRSDVATARWKARALHGAAWIAVYQGDPGASKVLMEQSVPLYREVGDREGVAIGLVHLGTLAVLHQRDDIPLRAVLEELKPGLENRGTLAYLLMLEGLVALGRGDLDHSAALHVEALGLLRKIGDTQGVISYLIHHGGIALARGDYEATTTLLREALRLARETDNKVFIQLCLHGLACVAALKQPIRAARLWGAVEGMKEAYGVHLTPITRSVTDYEGRLAGVRSHLQEEAFAVAWAEGKAMSLEGAIEYALS